MSRGNPRSWLWAEAFDLLRSAEHWQTRFVAVDAGRAVPCWEPAIDVYEQGDELTLFVALAGVRAEQVEIVVEPGGLLIRGQRPIPPTLKRAAIRRLEIPYGRFERRIGLPGGDYGLHERRIEDGCLILGLRRLR